MNEFNVLNVLNVFNILNVLNALNVLMYNTKEVSMMIGGVFRLSGETTHPIEGPLGRATPPPAIYDREPCGSDRQKWYAHQDRQMDDAKYVRIRSINAVRPVTTTKHDN